MERGTPVGTGIEEVLSPVLLPVVILLVVLASPARAADWPTWRADARRSAYSPEPLPARPSLLWTIAARHAPRPAWSGRDTRTPFDVGPRLAVAEGLVIFGSSADGSVRAVDAATGRERWSYFTEGPVRFGPTVHRGRAYVPSDDGYLHALRAETGELLWKLCGGPRESLVLGNGRVISRWPVRGAPVIAVDGGAGAGASDGSDAAGRSDGRGRSDGADGAGGADGGGGSDEANDGRPVDTLYFAAGIWQSEGISILAVDPETGQERWRNTTAGSIFMPQPHGGAMAASGVSAQGDLVVAGDLLLLPTGRSVPAAFRRSDGEFLYFHLQRYGHNRGGGSDIIAAGRGFLSAGLLFDLATGDLLHDGFGGHAVAAGPERLFAAARGAAAAFPAGEVSVERASVDRRGQPEVKHAAGAPAWRVEVGPTGGTGGSARAGGAAGVAETPRAVAASANAVVLGLDDRLLLLDAGTGERLCELPVGAPVHDIALAGGRLYASTVAGTIVAFGERAFGAGPLGERTQDHGPLATSASGLRDSDGAQEVAGPDPLHAAAAAEIVRLTGVREGWCVDLAAGDGSLSLALALATDLRIDAIEADPSAVERARRRLDAAGLLGVRVTVRRGDPSMSPYPGRFANLVVSGRSVTEGWGIEGGEDPTSDRPAALPEGEAFRLLRPWGGVSALGRPGTMAIRRRGALEGAGSWTHLYADPANTGCSGDRILTMPLEMLWFDDLAFEMPNRHGRPPAPLFLQGRLFVLGLHGLLALDAYNGRKLWDVELPGILEPLDQDHLMGTAGTGSNICLAHHGLYVHRGDRCLRIDPASGRVLAELQPPEMPASQLPASEVPASQLPASQMPASEVPEGPDGGKGTWGIVASDGDILFGTLADTGYTVKWRYQKGDMSRQYTESVLLFAMDPRTGDVLWRYRPERSIRNNAIAIGAGRVHLIDREPAHFDRLGSPQARRGEPEEGHPHGKLVTLRASSGERLWESGDSIFGTLLALSVEHDVLLMGYQDTRFKLDSEVGGRMAAFRASDGERIWDVEAAYASRPILSGASVHAQPGAWDLLTGRKLPFRYGRSYGCGIPSASRNLLFFRSATLGYVDLETGGEPENYGGIRPGCWINAIPAGGLLLMPDATDQCVCSYPLKASIALVPVDR